MKYERIDEIEARLTSLECATAFDAEAYRTTLDLLPLERCAEYVNSKLVGGPAIEVNTAIIRHTRVCHNDQTSELLRTIVRDDRNEIIRGNAIISLSVIEGAAAIGDIMAVATSPDEGIGVYGLKAAMNFDEPLRVDLLRRIFQAADLPDVKFYAALYLGYCGQADGERLLRSSLENPGTSYAVLVIAVECALANIGDFDAINRCRERLQHYHALPQWDQNLFLRCVGMCRCPCDPTKDLLQVAKEWLETA